MSLTYVNKELHFGGVSLVTLIKEKKFKTPFYLYDLPGIQNHLLNMKRTLGDRVSIHYAMKANSQKDLLKKISQLGVGVDTVSGGEIRRALSCGFKPHQIIFSGVGKSIEEIKLALRLGIYQINIESPQELVRVAQLAKKMKSQARVAFRLNPDVDVQTHPYITTGFRENKFGMDFNTLPELLEILKKYKNEVTCVGLTLHIGSQLMDLEALKEAIQKTLEVYKNLLGLGYLLQTFDIGGGIGIKYKDSETPPSLIDYNRMIKELFKDLNAQIIIEPGRYLVGSFGVLVTQVEYIKKTSYKNFAIVNTGMHHLMRPCLYGAYHEIKPLFELKNEKELYDIVGPICESSDVLGRARYLPQLNQGDYLVISDVGAYGFVMSNDYNLHSKPKEYILS